MVPPDAPQHDITIGSRALLDALFGDLAPGMFVEIRRISPQGQVQQDFLPTAQPWRIDSRWDGLYNVYYGICPRKRPGGRGEDVALAVALWSDDPRRPLPEGLPAPSIEIETSTGKFQWLWQLSEPSQDLGRVEEVNRRLAHALQGDNVGDRARVLRLPGFLNIKPEHPDKPRARIVASAPSFFTLPQFETFLPSVPGNIGNGKRLEDPFAPHDGVPVPDSVRAELIAAFKQHGLIHEHDGRWAGPCMFPHQGERCTCPAAFHVSDITGFWACFCDGHPGRAPGDGRKTASGGVGGLLRLVRGGARDRRHIFRPLPRVEVEVVP